MTTALCSLSCATSRKAEEARQTERADSARATLADSTALVTRVTLREAVPQEAARLAVPVTSLRDLPQGAAWRSQSGRASATLSVKDDTVWVDAQCDSLTRLCEVYEKTVERLHAENARYQSDLAMVERARDSPRQWGGVIFIAGFAAGSLLTNIIWRIRHGSDRRN